MCRGFLFFVGWMFWVFGLIRNKTIHIYREGEGRGSRKIKILPVILYIYY